MLCREDLFDFAEFLLGDLAESTIAEEELDLLHFKFSADAEGTLWGKCQTNTNIPIVAVEHQPVDGQHQHSNVL